MSRTYKDQKQNEVVRFARKRRQAEPMTEKYIRFKRCGPEGGPKDDLDDHLYDESADNICDEIDDSLNKNSDGDLCPDCGEPTHFELYYLRCAKCGWADYGDEALDRRNDDDEVAA